MKQSIDLSIEKESNIPKIIFRAGAILCATLAALSFMTRGAPGSVKEFIIYFAVPVGLGFFLALASKLPARHLWTPLVVGFSILSGMYAAEAYFQFFDSSTPANKPQIEGDTRKAPQVMLDLRKEGIVVYPLLPLRSRILVPHDGQLVSVFHDGLVPLGSISGTDTLFCNEGGPWRRFISDKYGFNNPRGAFDFPVIDIATIGDSFTMGVCVPPQNHSVGIIRDRFPRLLNFGRSGTGPLSQLAILKEYLGDIHPKVVLWFFIEDNDIFGDLRDELTSPALERYVMPGYRQGLAEKQSLIDQHLIGLSDKLLSEYEVSANLTKTPSDDIRHRFISTLKLTHIRGLLLLSSDPAFSAETKELFRRYTEILMEGRSTVGAWNGKVVLVYLPSFARFNSIRGKIWSDRHRRDVMAAAVDAEMPVIDLVPAFESQPQPTALFQGHYTSAGYGIVGQTVVDELIKMKLIDNTH